MPCEAFIEGVFAGPTEGVLTSTVHSMRKQCMPAIVKNILGLAQKQEVENEFYLFCLFQSFFQC